MPAGLGFEECSFKKRLKLQLQSRSPQAGPEMLVLLGGFLIDLIQTDPPFLVWQQLSE